MAIKGGAKLDAYLKDLARKVSNPGTLQVGFFEDATYPDGTKVALVAAIQNFGAPGAGIPARPFFTNMVLTKSDEWGSALAGLLKANGYDGRAALETLGGGIVGQLQQSIKDTNEPPLAESTAKAKGFSKPLIDTSLMWKSAAYKVTGS